MIVLALLALLVVAMFVTGIGRAALAGPERADRGPRLAFAPIVAGVGVVLVLAIVAALLMVLGLRGGDGGSDEPAPRSTPPAVAAAAPATSTTSTTPAAPDPPSRVLGPAIRVGAGTEAIGELRPDTVLRVSVTGFEPFAAAHAKQCVASRCGNVIAVQFDERGSASFQYLVVDDFVPDAERGRCRVDAPPCSIVVEHPEGDHRAAVVTLFHDPVPPPARLAVEPDTGVLAGQRLDVTVIDGPPGARVELVLCALPATPARCGAPGPVVPLTIGPDGSGRAAVPAERIEVGRDHADCGGGGGCAVALRSESALVHAQPARFRFAAPPGVSYDGGRVALALGVALVLLAVALVLLRATDWSPIGEEAAPEIDDAEYADLDAIVALLPPEDDTEPVLT